MKIAGFFACTEVVVTGTNPENADMDNPRGEEYGFASYVVAYNERGDRRRLYVSTSHLEADAEAEAEMLAGKLAKRLADGKPPVGFARWDHARPCYGSEAYLEYGQADDLELERMEG